jgi:hypothetical protein
MPQRNAAGQIWPNLKSDQAPKQQQRAPSLASAMYPRQSVEQRRWDEAHERDKEQTLQALRELNARIDARRR